MKEAEFRAWMEARRWNGKPLTSVTNRMSKARRFEKAMPALELGPADLDAAFDADGMEQVTQRLRDWCRAAVSTGQAPAELVGETTNAAMRMSNVASAVRNYRQFREAEAIPVSAWPALDELRASFLDRVPEFERFDQTDNEYERTERVYKDAIIVEVRAIIDSKDGDEEAGRRIFRALIPNEGPLLRWQTDDDFARKFPALAPAFYTAIGLLARDSGPVIDAIMAAATTCAELRQQGATTLTLGEISSIVLTVVGIAHPNTGAPFKISKAQTLAKLLTDDPIFIGSAIERGQVERWLALLQRVETVMRDTWDWRPRDLIDVQGFAWTVLDEKWQFEDGMTTKEALEALETLVVEGRLRRISSDDRLTKGIRYETSSGRQLQLELGNVVAQKMSGRLSLKDEGQARATLVLEADPRVPALTLQGATEISGVEYRPAMQYGGSHYHDGNSKLLKGQQACFYIDTLAGLHSLIDWYEGKPAVIWIVTARDGATDGLAGFVERGDWRLLEDRGGRTNDLARAMQPGDRIVLRDYIPFARDLPFDSRGNRVTALRFRATGVVTTQPNDGLSVGVDWMELPEERLWYFYTNNDPVWRLRTDNEMARMLAAFVLDGVPQDYDWFVSRWFDGETPAEDKTEMPEPTNLILYGPPGTGKTYATAAHAVRLCDGRGIDDPLFGPDQRNALMERYSALSKDERIEFVTFHQSTAYEEFVEGLRPSSVDEDGLPLAAGFRLVPTPGIFRTIARRAELSTGAVGEAFTVGDRQVFKMSIGDATKAEWAWLFDEAIAEGYTYLGFGDIDWSDARFDDREAMLAAVTEHEGQRGEFAEGTEPSLKTGPVKSPDLFRNALKIGDVIVVSKGLSLFRAIGLVEGPYEYAPRGDGHYSHRRKVRWLWSDEDGVRVAEINTKRLSIETIYRLNRENLNIPALERYANSQHRTGSGTPEPFVLVIDEINRANISKVFGELITLLEPDKRQGQLNEIKVRLPYSGDLFGVPANLHIIGTMNTADRSIALLDTALRRRFEFRELMPNPDLPELKKLGDPYGVDLPSLLRTLNERIEYLFDREHQIGHAYFLGCDTRDKLHNVMRHKIIPLLAEYFYEDWSKVAAVLGDTFEDDGKDHEGGFIDRERLRSPFAKDAEWGDDAARYRWRVRTPGQGFTYDRVT